MCGARPQVNLNMANRHAILTLYAAITLLAFTGLFAKVLPADAVTITQVRSVVACIGFVLFLKLQGRTLLLGSWREYAGVYALGVVVGAHWATFFHAMQISTIAVGILSFYSYPVITVLMEPFFNHRRLRFADLASAVMVVYGIAILVVDDFSDPGSWAINDYLAGALWGVASAVLMSVRNLFQKYYFPKVPSSSLMFHQIVAICIFAAPLVDFQAVAAFDVNTWWLVVALGLFATAAGHTLIVVSLKTLPAKSVAMISCLQPLLAIFLGWLVLDENPSQQVYIGGALIITVALYESWRQSRKVLPTV